MFAESIDTFLPKCGDRSDYCNLAAHDIPGARPQSVHCHCEQKARPALREREQECRGVANGRALAYPGRSDRYQPVYEFRPRSSNPQGHQRD